MKRDDRWAIGSIALGGLLGAGATTLLAVAGAALLFAGPGQAVRALPVPEPPSAPVAAAEAPEPPCAPSVSTVVIRRGEAEAVTVVNAGGEGCDAPRIAVVRGPDEVDLARIRAEVEQVRVEAERVRVDARRIRAEAREHAERIRREVEATTGG